MNLDSIRRAVRAKGLTPATLVPEASGGRVEEACIRPARVIEGDSLRMIPIGLAEAWPGSLAYLDGIQQSEIIAYDGSAPILVAEIAAAVRVREDRRLHTSVQERRRVALGRPSALTAAGDALAELQAIHFPRMSRLTRCATWPMPAMPWIRRVARWRSLSATATAAGSMAGSWWTGRSRRARLGCGRADGGRLEEPFVLPFDGATSSDTSGCPAPIAPRSSHRPPGAWRRCGRGAFGCGHGKGRICSTA